MLIVLALIIVFHLASAALLFAATIYNVSATQETPDETERILGNVVSCVCVIGSVFGS